MKPPTIRRTGGLTPPGKSHRGGSNPLILCQLRPPAYRLSACDANRLLADPRVRAQGWNRAKLESAIGNLAIPALQAQFSVFVPGVKVTYSVTNAESGELVIARISEGERISFDLFLLNRRDADDSASFFQSHLLGAMSRYLAIQGTNYLEAIDLTAEREILEALDAELVRGLGESIKTLSKKEMSADETATAAKLVQQAVAESINVIVENWFIRRLASAIAVPEAFFEEGATQTADSFERTLKNTLSELNEGGIVFLPPIVVESAAYASALEYHGFPRLSLAIKNQIERTLIAYIPAFLLKAFPELATMPLALPAQQRHFLNQAMLTFDEVKKFYLKFIPKIALKPAFRG